MGHVSRENRDGRYRPAQEGPVLYASLPCPYPSQHLQRRERGIHGGGLQGAQEFRHPLHFIQQLGHIPYADTAPFHARPGCGLRGGALAQGFRGAVRERPAQMGDGEYRDRHHAGRPYPCPDSKCLGLRGEGLRPSPGIRSDEEQCGNPRAEVPGGRGASWSAAVQGQGLVERIRAAGILYSRLRHREVRPACLRRRVCRLALFGEGPVLEESFQPGDRMAAVPQCRRFMEVPERGLERVHLSELFLDGAVQYSRPYRHHRRTGKCREASG